MNLFNVPVYCNFLKSVLDFTMERADDGLSLSKITILLPSRRSCNELKRLFLENSSDGAVILPNIRAIGDIDYDDILLKNIDLENLDEIETISINTSRIKYKILLIKELLKWASSSNKTLFKNITVEQASNLSLELEKFLNEVQKNGLQLDNLDQIVDDEYSQHWQEILDFLGVFGKKWTDFTLKNNIISTIDYKTKMIEFNARYFEKNRPNNPIIIAGVNGNIKSTCGLIQSLMQYDNCHYIFKGLDTLLNEEEWQSINEFHPQFYNKQLLEKCLGADRTNVKDIIFEKNIVANRNIEKIITYSMLPYKYTYKWQDKLAIEANFFENISKIECDDIMDELKIISYITKYNFEETSSTIAIIVSNENFANQLEIELRGLNVSVNNAFGNNISRTEVVKFLFLMLDTIRSNFEPIALLSLLKHNFSLFGYEKDRFEWLTFLLEENILRGAGNLGAEGIGKRINDLNNPELKEFWNRIFNSLNALFNGLEIQDKKDNLQKILKQHLEIAEKIASNDEIEGNNVFWNNSENGVELLNFFNDMIIDSVEYGTVKTIDEYSYLLNYLIAENSYSDRYSIHPMVSIISPQEARLINYDLVIVANLNDGEFPPHIPTDPWMSRSMRKSFGLPNRDEIIGSFASDFSQYLGNSQVILTRSLKNNGVPNVKSKYLMRLETFLECQGGLRIKNDEKWKLILEKYNNVDRIISIARPKPTPPLELRPRELYATKIEKLMNNPYDIYAEKILKLKKKDDFYEDRDFAFFGSAVHEALENYIKNYDDLDKTKLYDTLMEYGKNSFNRYFTEESTREIFFIRFSNIAAWFIEQDENIRRQGYKVFAEKERKLYIQDLDFTVSAKVDRIEESNVGSINICDYKTGSKISNSDVIAGKKPQLTIEAIILEKEGKSVDNLVYWYIKGKGSESKQEIKADIGELTENAEDGLRRLIAHFNMYENSYIATSYDLNSSGYTSDYKHLSRVDEWGYL